MISAVETAPRDDVALGKRIMLRHGIATLAYRGGKVIRSAPPFVASFRIREGTRTPLELLTHIGDLLEWTIGLAEGSPRWEPKTPDTWDAESARFFDLLGRVDAYVASDRPLVWSAERLLQGPIADALTHVGQIAMLRRVAGSPIRSENFAKADIVLGRVSDDQTPPKYEFD